MADDHGGTAERRARPATLAAGGAAIVLLAVTGPAGIAVVVLARPRLGRP